PRAAARSLATPRAPPRPSDNSVDRGISAGTCADFRCWQLRSAAWGPPMPSACVFSGPSRSFFSSRRRHTRSTRDWSSDVCSSDLGSIGRQALDVVAAHPDRLRVTRSGHRGDDLVALATADDVDVVLVATPGIAGLEPTLRSEERRVGKDGGAQWDSENTREQLLGV